MRHVTTRLLRRLLARRAHERGPANPPSGTAPVFGSFHLLCPACANRLVLRVGPRGLGYYCACPSGHRPPDGQASQASAGRGLRRTLPPRPHEQGEEVTNTQQETVAVLAHGATITA